MQSLNNIKNNYFLLFLLPISLIFSAAISTLLISIMAIIGLIFYFKYRIKVQHINNIIFLIFLWCIYLIFCSLISNNIFLSLESSLFYVRFILFSIFIYFYLLNDKHYFFELILLYIILFVLIDSSIQFFFGDRLLHTLFPHDYTIQAKNYRYVDRKCMLVHSWPIIILTSQLNKLLNYATDGCSKLY